MLSSLVLLLLLFWSLWVVAQQIMPKTMSRLRVALAQQCVELSPQLAALIRPRQPKGCASGCSCPIADNKPKIDATRTILQNISQSASQNNSLNIFKNTAIDLQQRTEPLNQPTFLSTATSTKAMSNTATSSAIKSDVVQPVRWRN